MCPALRCASLLSVFVPFLCAHPEAAEARAALDKLVAEFPGESDLYLERAELHIEHSEWTEAEADLRRGGKLAPHSARIATARGQLSAAQGDIAAAEKHFDAALALAPTDAEILVLRARVRARLSDATGAHADYSKAIHLLASPSPDLFLSRAALPIAPELALAGIDEGLTRLGPVISLIERALAIDLHLGRTDAALVRLDMLAIASGRKEACLKYRGDILAAAGRADEARAAYGAALAAIAALPAWLRESSEAARLATELTPLAATSSDFP